MIVLFLRWYGGGGFPGVELRAYLAWVGRCAKQPVGMRPSWLLSVRSDPRNEERLSREKRERERERQRWEEQKDERLREKWEIQLELRQMPIIEPRVDWSPRSGCALMVTCAPYCQHGQRGVNSRSRT